MIFKGFGFQNFPSHTLALSPALGCSCHRRRLKISRFSFGQIPCVFFLNIGKQPRDLCLSPEYKRRPQLLAFFLALYLVTSVCIETRVFINRLIADLLRVSSYFGITYWSSDLEKENRVFLSFLSFKFYFESNSFFFAVFATQKSQNGRQLPLQHGPQRRFSGQFATIGHSTARNKLFLHYKLIFKHRLIIFGLGVQFLQIFRNYLIKKTVQSLHILTTTLVYNRQKRSLK